MKKKKKEESKMRKILVVLLVLTAAYAYAGKVKSVKGDVKAMIGGKWQAAKAGMQINDGTALMTGFSSSVVITYGAGEFKLQELSKATFTEKTKADLTKSGVNLEMGKVKVKYDKQAAQGKIGFTVQTPEGSASVRGTEELVIYFPDLGMSVFVLVGEVSIDNISGISGSLFVGQGAQPEGLGIDPNSDQLNEFLTGFSGIDPDFDESQYQGLLDLLQDYLGIPIIDFSIEPQRI